MNGKVVIAIVGKRGSGKDAFADVLSTERGYFKFKLATPIKTTMAHLMATLVGEPSTANKYEAFMEDRWRKEMDFVPFSDKVTLRRCMQLFGTEFGRDVLGKDIWVKSLLRRINKSLCDYVVVSDVRYVNEAEALSDAGAYIIRVVRDVPKLDGAADEHPSETEMDGIVADHTVYNNGSLDDLRKEALTISDIIDSQNSGVRFA